MNKYNSIIRNKGRNHFLRDMLDDLFLFDRFLSSDITKLNSKDYLFDKDLNLNSDLKEDSNNYYLTVEAPGVNKEDIDVKIDSNQLFIRVEKNQEKIEDDKKIHFSEIYYGSFSKNFTFSSPVDSENVKASYKNGILNLVVPKVSDLNKVSKVNID